MNIQHRRAQAAACLLLVSLLALPAEAQFRKLVKRVPTSVNTIILLNAEKVLNSEVALREGWRTNFQKATAAGVTHLPEDTQQYVMAAETDFEYMHPVWQVGVLTTSKKHDMVYVASKQKGTQDTIAGLPAVLLPSNNYLIQLDPTTYAMMVPASRQAVSRWIQSTIDESPTFSPYIQEAIDYSDKSGTEIIMAMDLTDVLDLDTVRDLVKESKEIADAGVDVEKASKVLCSLRGVMLGITFSASPFGSIKVDFGEDISVLKGVGHQLLLAALAKHGAMIDDFAGWEAKVSDKQIRLIGKFSAGGLRQVFSLMDSPTASSVPTAAGDDQSAGEQDTPVVATQKYFASLNRYFQDLRNKEPQRIAQYGIWFDKYARKIDQLPMVNVDNEMLDYGAYVAQQFRNAGAAIQGIGIRSRVRQVEGNTALASGGGYSNFDGAYNFNGVAYGGYGWGGYARGFGVGSNAVGMAQQAGLRAQQRMGTTVRVQEKAMGTSAARAIIKDIENTTAEVRRAMTQKYNVEFK